MRGTRKLKSYWQLWGGISLALAMIQSPSAYSIPAFDRDDKTDWFRLKDSEIERLCQKGSVEVNAVSGSGVSGRVTVTKTMLDNNDLECKGTQVYFRGTDTVVPALRTRVGGEVRADVPLSEVDSHSREHSFDWGGGPQSWDYDWKGPFNEEAALKAFEDFLRSRGFKVENGMVYDGNGNSRSVRDLFNEWMNGFSGRGNGGGSSGNGAAPGSFADRYWGGTPQGFADQYWGNGGSPWARFGFGGPGGNGFNDGGRGFGPGGGFSFGGPNGGWPYGGPGGGYSYRGPNGGGYPWGGGNGGGWRYGPGNGPGPWSDGYMRYAGPMSPWDDFFSRYGNRNGGGFNFGGGNGGGNAGWPFGGPNGGGFSYNGPNGGWPFGGPGGGGGFSFNGPGGNSGVNFDFSGLMNSLRNSTAGLQSTNPALYNQLWAALNRVLNAVRSGTPYGGMQADLQFIANNSPDAYAALMRAFPNAFGRGGAGTGGMSFEFKGQLEPAYADILRAAGLLPSSGGSSSSTTTNTNNNSSNNNNNNNNSNGNTSNGGGSFSISGSFVPTVDNGYLQVLENGVWKFYKTNGQTAFDDSGRPVYHKGSDGRWYDSSGKLAPGYGDMSISIVDHGQNNNNSTNNNSDNNSNNNNNNSSADFRIQYGPDGAVIFGQKLAQANMNSDTNPAAQIDGIYGQDGNGGVFFGKLRHSVPLWDKDHNVQLDLRDGGSNEIDNFYKQNP